MSAETHDWSSEERTMNRLARDFESISVSGMRSTTESESTATTFGGPMSTTTTPLHKPDMRKVENLSTLSDSVEPDDKLVRSKTAQTNHTSEVYEKPRRSVSMAASMRPKESSRSRSERKKGKQQAVVNYAAECVVDSGSFGTVYQATVIETGETVAIKKVLQDQRFKNRELSMMSCLNHPSVIRLRHCFYSRGSGRKRHKLYLNLVMDYIPQTIGRTIRAHAKALKLLPLMYVKAYTYQICRGLAYVHSIGITHRDVKPQNLLLDPLTHRAVVCDFGSAKRLKEGEPSVSYICSRYYRAPELVFDATHYTTAVDTWSLGCVVAEMLLGSPLFPGRSSVDQLVEIIRILGTPSREQIRAMNPKHTSFNFPKIRPHSFARLFRDVPVDAIDFVAQMLRYVPTERIDLFNALVHPFFDDLRAPGARLPNGKPLPITPLTEDEVALAKERGMYKKMVLLHGEKVWKPPKDSLANHPSLMRGGKSSGSRGGADGGRDGLQSGSRREEHRRSDGSSRSRRTADVRSRREHSYGTDGRKESAGARSDRKL